ncbi:unnamed protein product [Durusdinium trenchii]|uniref:PNPLA domain-containing protein n=1 Tax=Durusdinium trenchii TaxID=1381693 RepID=A0ABP0QAG0_9DINO
MLPHWCLWCLAGLAALAQEEVSDDECATKTATGCATSWLQRRAAQRSEENVSWGWSSAPEDLGEVPLGSCFQDTGGSCSFFSCDSSRGEVSCESRRCKCKAGYCNHRGACVSQHQNDRCVRQTDHTCRVFACSSIYGNTTCESGHCMCAPGHCQVDGFCYKDRGRPWRAKVVSITQEFPRFPQHVTRALAFSGGGGRAFAFTLGVLRALEELQLMRRVDAISSVSGGSWATSVYMFSTLKVSYLLGQATQPEELTMDFLEKTNSALGTVGAVGTSAIAGKLISDGIEFQELWVNTISKAILEPFGLHDLDSYMASDHWAVEDIRRRNPELRAARFLTPAPGRPRVFVMSGAILGPTGYKATKENVVSLQMSPDFIGSPFYPNDAPVSYESQDRRWNPKRKGLVGGGFVESFAFGGSPPQEVADGWISTEAPLQPFSLAKAVGVSSAGVSAASTQGPLHGVINLAKLSPRSDYWAIPSPKFERPKGASTYLLGDGGNIDNSGLLAMLQRRASKVVLVVSTGHALPDDVDFCALGQQELSSDVAERLENQLRANFGYWEKDDIGEFLTQNHVFRKKDLAPLLCQLQSLKKRGQPTVAQRRLQVLPNRWWGIRGGFSVDLLMVYLDKCQNFESRLPKDTADNLQSYFHAEFARFPHYRVVFQNAGSGTALTHPQINLLAAMGEFFVRENAELFRRLLQ